MRIFLIALFLPLTSFAWTLNNNFAASFKKNEVKVFIDAGTTCANNNLTVNDLEGLIGPAVSNFWNKVPTSALKLQPSGFSEAIFTMNEGRLCSPTDDSCIAAGTAAGNDGTPADGLIPAVEEIVIACNRNPLNFGGNNVLAVTIPNKFSGKKIAGAVILINNTPDSGAFGRLSKSDQEAVIAHEIGHAIGLGHSEDVAALMYYRTVNLRRRLGQDDINGVSFLYPVKGDLFGLMGGDKGGLLAGCGTISADKKTPPGGSILMMMLPMGVMIFIFSVYQLLNRAKRSSSF
jgi:hypothetical protein